MILFKLSASLRVRKNLTVSCYSAVLGDHVNWTEEQEKDTVLKRVIQIIKDGVHVNARKEGSHVLKMMRRQSLLVLKVKDRVLYWRIQGTELYFHSMLLIRQHGTFRNGTPR